MTFGGRSTEDVFGTGVCVSFYERVKWSRCGGVKTSCLSHRSGLCDAVDDSLSF